MSADTRRQSDRLARWLNVAPLILMSGGWIAPLTIFWSRVWGPLLPFDVAPVPAPGAVPFLLGFLACISVWWLPRAYYAPRAFEANGKVYERLGIRRFKRFVPDGELVNAMRRRGDRAFRLIHDRESARVFLQRTNDSERGHLVLLLMGILSALWAVRVGWYGWAMFLTVGNGVINLYPVLLQRYTRVRILRVCSSQFTAHS